MGTKTKAKGKATATTSASAKAKESSKEISALPRSSSSRLVAAKPVAEGASPKTKSKKSKQAEKAELVDASKGGEDDDSPKRALGLRGAAPWAARHAAKHAEEARKRAAEPPPPGSARATTRTPAGVEGIKLQIMELHNQVERIKSLRKNLAKSFFDIGLILREIQQTKGYTAKGFQSFEAFVDREVELGKTLSMRLVKLVGIFQKEAAIELGLDRAIEALIHLEGGAEAAATRESDSRLPVSKPALPSSATRGPIVGR